MANFPKRRIREYFEPNREISARNREFLSPLVQGVLEQDPFSGQLAAILPRHTHRVPAILRKARIVHD